MSYLILGILMGVSPVAAFIYTWIRQRQDHYIFTAEMFGIYAFSAYWVLKITEMKFIREHRTLELDRRDIPA